MVDTNNSIQRYIEEPLSSGLIPDDFNKEYARHDKNIAINVADFFVYGPRAKLCMNLTLYIHYTYQNRNTNLYGYYPFNLNHFTKLFSWTDSLQRTVDDKSELYITEHRDAILRAFDVEEESDNTINERMISNIERFASTKIGDAFIRLAFQGIIYSNKAFYYEGEGSKLYSGRKVTFLDEFVADYVKLKGKASKLVVEYKPNQQTLLNNVKNYAYTNIKLLGKLRKTDNLDFLHLYISYVLNKLKTERTEFCNIWTVPRRTFAKLLGLNPEREVKEINKAIRRKVNKYCELTLEPVAFRLPKNDFTVVIEFPELKPVNKEQRKVAMQWAFNRYFEQEMFENYIKYHVNTEDNPLTFKQWINNPMLDIDQKKFAFIAAQRVIFKKKLTIAEVREEDCLKINVISEIGGKKVDPGKNRRLAV